MPELSTISTSKRVIGFSEMKEKYLPHRYPIIMLDRITDYREGEYIEAIKCVTGNSPELVGHFPDRAIMPATFVIQAFAQLAIVFFKLSNGALTDDEMTLITSTKFKFLGPIFPGDTLKLILKPSRLTASVGIFNSNALVDDKSVVRGTLTLAKTSVSKFENSPW
jgi:3-hydroxyacyl-[acyl-carrier-protein] dehydratase